MKTNLHYSNVKPVTPQPTNKNMLKAGIYVVSLFAVTVLVLAGADLIDQIMIWIK